MTLRFRPRKKGKNYLVYIYIYTYQEEESISTGLHCSAAEWNFSKKGPKNHDTDLKRKLVAMEAAINDVAEKMKTDKKVITAYSLKHAYLESLKTKVVKQLSADQRAKAENLNVSQWVDKYLEKGLDDYSPTTTKDIRVSLNTHFKAYLTRHAPFLEKEDLTLEFITDYARHLTNEGYYDSTHGKYMMHLKWFLAYMKWNANEREEIVVKQLKSGENNKIFLTREELTQLEAYDCSPKPGVSVEMERAKDLFLLACYTGMRISEIKRIEPVDIQDGCICMTQEKTGKRIEVPLLHQTKAILKRYDNYAPKLAEQKINDWIKIICDENHAKITTPTVKLGKAKGKVIKMVKPKNKLITTHVGGKTFITLAQAWGMTPFHIATIVGKDIRTVMKYYMNPDLVQAKQAMLEGVAKSQMQVVKEKKRQA